MLGCGPNSLAVAEPPTAATSSPATNANTSFIVTLFLFLGAALAALTPQRPGLLIAPALPRRLELLDLRGLLRRQVLGLADIPREVVEPGWGDARLPQVGHHSGVGGGVIADQLPLAVADRHLRTEAPVQRIMRAR